MKLYLIGMPGSGKSHVGRQLAEKLALPFIDLDHEIEKEEGRSIKDIFTEGEDYFRQVESRLLAFFARSSGSFVLATGGGAPCFYDGIKIINESGVSVFLDVAVDELLSRVEGDVNRPLLLSDGKEELKARLTGIRNNRLPVYSQANITVNHSDLNTILEKLDVRK